MGGKEEEISECGVSAIQLRGMMNKFASTYTKFEEEYGERERDALWNFPQTAT